MSLNNPHLVHEESSSTAVVEVFVWEVELKLQVETLTCFYHDLKAVWSIFQYFTLNRTNSSGS